MVSMLALRPALVDGNLAESRAHRLMGRTPVALVPPRPEPLDLLREAYVHDELSLGEFERCVGQYLGGETIECPPRARLRLMALTPYDAQPLYQHMLYGDLRGCSGTIIDR